MHESGELIMMVEILMCFVLSCSWGGGGAAILIVTCGIYMRLCAYKLVGLIRKTFGFCLGLS